MGAQANADTNVAQKLASGPLGSMRKSYRAVARRSEKDP